jgi:hypothetical protein
MLVVVAEAGFEEDVKGVDRRDFLSPSPMMWTVWGLPELRVSRSSET